MNFSPKLAGLLPRIQERYFAAMPSMLYYHDLDHTKLVIRLAMLLGNKANLNQYEFDSIYAAAVLHDTGYANMYRNNENQGAEHARIELPIFGFDQDQIDLVVSMISATNYGSAANSKLECLIKDADLGYLGLDEFMKWSDRLRREYTFMGTFKGEPSDWLINQIEFLSQHQFHSSEGIALFEEGKQDNLKRLRALLEWPF